MCLLRVCSAVRTRAGREITVRLKGHSRPNFHCQLVRELARMAKLRVEGTHSCSIIRSANSSGAMRRSAHFPYPPPLSRSLCRRSFLFNIASLMPLRVYARAPAGRSRSATRTSVASDISIIPKRQ
jgi:hypothetical protein